MQNGGSDDDTSANRERRGTRFVMITVSNLFTFVSLFVGNNTTSRLKYTATRKGKMQC